MSSPFPGMDPYLEGYLWPDVHSALANKIRQHLTPHLIPRYVARLEIAVIQDDDAPDTEVKIMYPDVEVLKTWRVPTLTAPPPLPRGRSGAVREAVLDIPTAPLTVPLTYPVLPSIRTRQVTIEIRDGAQNELVTSIEILSPVNKREPNLTKYRKKRKRLYEAGVHLLEIDLLRRGKRPLSVPTLPKTPYLVTLTRSKATSIEVWPIQLQDKLPLVPVPLRAPDPDVPLDLSSVLAAIYEEAAYHITIDYRKAPPPPQLSKQDMAWVRKQLERREGDG